MPRIFCIGRNYVEHARELNSQVPAEPVVFMKPPESLVPPGHTVPFPAHGDDLHHEVELVLRVGSTAGTGQPTLEAITVGVDLTLRDVQKRLKAAGLPWEAAKAFEHSALAGEFVPVTPRINPDRLSLWLDVNGERRQSGNTEEMIFSTTRLLEHLASIWRLVPGDLVFTGTPAGVGSLAPGDEISAGADQVGSFTWRIGA
ncbi:MAG: fumarylacetoacetate hydrolase family protein [Gammaproteobacteria bacterium]